ncbi:hypothetical protein D3Z52_20815 [Clostridiaceae bacterium]|nr:hypothetical protein [Clostridiaceae bacterium]
MSSFFSNFFVNFFSGSLRLFTRSLPPAGVIKFLLDFFTKKSQGSRGQRPLAQPAQGRTDRNCCRPCVERDEKEKSCKNGRNLL